MGYKGVNSVATSDYIEQTPLHNLLQNPVAGGTATQERLAQFKVVFTKKEVLQVSPWRGIGNSYKLSDNLTHIIPHNWAALPLLPEVGSYRHCPAKHQ
jgi:hypothetical protein